MTLNVTTWLNELGLGAYAPAFADNDIDAKTLPQLTSSNSLHKPTTRCACLPRLPVQSGCKTLARCHAGAHQGAEGNRHVHCEIQAATALPWPVRA